MPRLAKITTTDPEITATYEVDQAMKRFWLGGNMRAKQRVLLHMAMKHLPDKITADQGKIWLQLS